MVCLHKLIGDIKNGSDNRVMTWSYTLNQGQISYCAMIAIRQHIVALRSDGGWMLYIHCRWYWRHSWAEWAAVSLALRDHVLTHTSMPSNRLHLVRSRLHRPSTAALPGPVDRDSLLASEPSDQPATTQPVIITLIEH